jgi:hypothetical protein
MTTVYLTNELGDVDKVDEDGVIESFDPSVWGWQTHGGRHDFAEYRRSIDSLRGVTGFDIEESHGKRFVPGPRVRRAVWGQFHDGAAPPAAQRSLGGSGTIAYFDRLSEALGATGQLLPSNPGRSPMIVYDFVIGREFTIQYAAPAPTATGHGTVYLLEDGFGIKVGYTNGPVAKRVAELQIGNSRKITSIAEILDATPETEALLHSVLNEWNVTGEWFAREPVIVQAGVAGGFDAWLKKVLGADWPMIIHPPYR